MKYDPINKELFIRNRIKLANSLDKNSLAVFNSNDIFPIGGDSTMPFQQNRDLFYLSGVDQEESILVIFPDCHNQKHREVLFLRETNEHIAVWEGEKLTKEKAFETAGIKTVYWLDQFEQVFKTLMAEAEGVYINTNEHLRGSTEVETREDRFIKWCKAEYPGHQYKKSAPILHAIRSVKEDIELDLMQTACNITGKGVNRILNFIKPGVSEHEIQAEIAHEFMMNRSRGFSYDPIIASGKNACVLHYTQNNQLCNDGDLILMDFGAEYANYSSDLTRTVPVNGKFTDRQKTIYNAVLRVKTAATKLLVPGTLLGEFHKEVGRLMEEELLQLGILTQEEVKNQSPEKPAYKKYFMHGTSHFIGLETHDSGLWHKPIQAGMVFTVEPGIYLPDENIGIRLEDDVVVQEKGEPLNMMGHIPIEVEEVEEAMNA